MKSDFLKDFLLIMRKWNQEMMTLNRTTKNSKKMDENFVVKAIVKKENEKFSVCRLKRRRAYKFKL